MRQATSPHSVSTNRASSTIAGGRVLHDHNNPLFQRRRQVIQRTPITRPVRIGAAICGDLPLPARCTVKRTDVHFRAARFVGEI